MNLDEELSALLSGDLPPAEAEALRQRIAREPEVAARWEAVQRLCADLDDLDLPEVDEDRVRQVVDGAEPRPRWRPWLAAGVAAAAGVLVGILLSPREPVSVAFERDGVVIEGRAVVHTGDVRIDLDGTAQIRTVGDGGVTVIEGSGRVIGPPEPIELGARERWTPPAPPERGAAARSVSPRDEALERAEATVERLRVELALARGRLATHEGLAPVWPADVPAPLLPGAFESEVRRALVAVVEVELLAVDCSEYPCAALVYQALGPREARDWPGLLRPLAERVPGGWEVVDLVREEERGGVRHTAAVLALLRGGEAEAMQARLLFRGRELIEAHQPDVMR